MDPTRATLQALFIELFPIAADFEAFAGDYFPSVSRLWSSGMHREQQIDLLLQKLAPHQILSALISHFYSSPLMLRTIEERIASLHTPEKRAEYDLNQRILELSQELAVRRTKNVPLDALLARLSEMKRQRRALREGPGLRVGHVFNGRYKLLLLIGKGGFADVWQAYDQAKRMVVAIKVLHPDQASSPDQIERFHRGARTLQTLAHGAIVRLLADPAEEDGFHYVVLEYAPGGDLEVAVGTLGLSREAGMQVVLQVADALIFAHRQGFIHRDIKPRNILLAADGSARLTDFDLVRALDSSANTRTGAALGTLLYAAPEQFEDSSQVDVRADIYSLGMTALLVLHGRSPLPNLLQDPKRRAFIANLRCPRALRDVLQKAVESEPAKRYQTMQELAVALQRAVPILPIAPQPPPEKERSSVHPFLRYAAYGGSTLVLLTSAYAVLSLLKPQVSPGALPNSDAASSMPPAAAQPVVVTPLTEQPTPDGSVRSAAAPANPANQDTGKRGTTPPRAGQGSTRIAKDPPREGASELWQPNRDVTKLFAVPAAKAPDNEAQRTTSVPVPADQSSSAAASTPTGPANELKGKKSAEDVMRDAQTAYVRGERQRSIEIALQVAERGGPASTNAWRFIGSAACSIRSFSMATRAHTSLTSPDHRQMVIELCERNGMVLEKGVFVSAD